MALQGALFYNLANVILSINGLRVRGFGASDAFSATPDADLNNRTKSADGITTYSVVNDRTYTATITVGQVTEGARTLYDLINEQFPQAGGTSIATVPILIIDNTDPARDGTRMSGNLVFTRMPDMPFNQDAGEYVFTAHLTNVQIDILPGLA